MPRGKYVNHKGRGRSFTSAEELARENKDIENKKSRKKSGEDTSEDEEDKPAETTENVVKDSESESESESEDDENRKAKGVEGLLSGMIENPNRRVVKVKKISKLDEDVSGGGAAAAGGGGAAAAPEPELSRREREAIEKQKAKAHYQKLHAEGKTDEARKDLARLAIIRKQRDDAKKAREQEQQDKDALKQNKQQEIGKALGKK